MVVFCFGVGTSALKFRALDIPLGSGRRGLPISRCNQLQMFHTPYVRAHGSKQLAHGSKQLGNRSIIGANPFMNEGCGNSGKFGTSWALLHAWS